MVDKIDINEHPVDVVDFFRRFADPAKFEIGPDGIRSRKYPRIQQTKGLKGRLPGGGWKYKRLRSRDDVGFDGEGKHTR